MERKRNGHQQIRTPFRKPFTTSLSKAFVLKMRVQQQRNLLCQQAHGTRFNKALYFQLRGITLGREKNMSVPLGLYELNV